MYGKWITKTPLNIYKTEGGISVVFSIKPDTSDLVGQGKTKMMESKDG